MNSELILQSEVLDLLFEKRNKLYGAYTLRKFYTNRLIKSILTTLTVVFIVCAFTFLPKKTELVFSVEEVKLTGLKPVKIKESKKVLPHQQIKAAGVNQRKFLTPLIVATNIPADTLQTINAATIIAGTNTYLNGMGTSGLIGADAVDSDGSNTTEIKSGVKPANPNELVANPDILPAYPGGIPALRKFLERNLVNPAQMEGNETVAVNVGFIVGYDGMLQNFSIQKDGGELFNKEVLRVLKKMPQWIPGKANGKNVAVYFTIPVKFVSAD